MGLRKYTYVDFSTHPPVNQFIKMGSYDMKPVNTLRKPWMPGVGSFWVDGNYFEYKAANAANNIPFVKNFPPGGWLFPIVAGDDTAGIEVTQGVTAIQGQNQFVTGTDAFFMQCLFYVGTLANVDNLQMGFRAIGDYVAGAVAEPTGLDTAYSDLAMMGIRSTDGAPYSNTRAGSGTAVPTRASHANAAATSWLALRIEVTAAGVVTYKIGTSSASSGAAITALASDLLLTPVTYTFTSALTVIPSIVVSSSGTGYVDWGILKYNCGLL